MSLSEAQHRQHKQIKQLHLPPHPSAISVLQALDQSPVSRQKVICCNSWECMSPTATSDPVLLHGPRGRGRTSVWLRAYLRNCATLAIKAPAPGCSTFPDSKDTIPVNWLHYHSSVLPSTRSEPHHQEDRHENLMLHTNPFQPHETCEYPTGHEEPVPHSCPDQELHWAEAVTHPHRCLPVPQDGG